MGPEHTRARIMGVARLIDTQVLSLLFSLIGLLAALFSLGSPWFWYSDESSSGITIEYAMGYAWVWVQQTSQDDKFSTMLKGTDKLCDGDAYNSACERAAYGCWAGSTCFVIGCALHIWSLLSASCLKGTSCMVALMLALSGLLYATGAGVMAGLSWDYMHDDLSASAYYDFSFSYSFYTSAGAVFANSLALVFAACNKQESQDEPQEDKSAEQEAQPEEQPEHVEVQMTEEATDKTFLQANEGAVNEATAPADASDMPPPPG